MCPKNKTKKRKNRKQSKKEKTPSLNSNETPSIKDRGVCGLARVVEGPGSGVFPPGFGPFQALFWRTFRVSGVDLGVLLHFSGALRVAVA